MAWFLGSLPVCFFHPFYGIILWTIVAFLNPQAYAWSAATALPWAVLAAVPTLLGFFAFDRGLHRIPSRESVLLLILWLWFTFTSVVSTSSALFMHHAG